MEINRNSPLWQCPELECKKRSVIFLRDPLIEALISAIKEHEIADLDLLKKCMMDRQATVTIDKR